MKKNLIKTNELKKVIIDTDPGHDDVLAIMLAIKSGVFDVMAITTVVGNSIIENTTRNARFVLNLLNREDIPVYSGADKPLSRDLVQAVVHGKSGLDGINPKNDAKLTNDAVEQILRIVSENLDEIILIVIGPMTNIANAIKKDRETMLRVREIICMAGAINVPGNKNRVAEFNVFVDPEAADTVINFPVKKSMVPLDACNLVELQLSDFARIKNIILRETLLKMMKPFIEYLVIDECAGGARVYDALAVYSIMNPAACKVEPLNIQVETMGELTRGMTVAEFRRTQKIEPNADVVMQIKKAPFVRDLIKILSK